MDKAHRRDIYRRVEREREIYVYWRVDLEVVLARLIFSQLIAHRFNIKKSYTNLKEIITMTGNA